MKTDGNSNGKPSRRATHEPLVIGDGVDGRSWWGFTAWLLGYLAVAGVLVAVFVRFTASVGWAVGLVGFMLVYMTVMARWTSRNVEGRE